VALVIVGGYWLEQSLAGRLVPAAPPATVGRGLNAVGAVSVILLASVFGLLSAERLAAYQTELGLWQDALEHQPENSLVHINLGIQLDKAGSRERAMRHFDEALRLAPDSFQAHYNLARALEQSGRTREAIDHYRQTLRLKPAHAAARTNLGRLLEGEGKTDQAVDQYREALRFAPDFGPAHNNLGILLLNAGDVPQAIVHFEQALGSHETIEGYTNLATAYALAGRSADAVATAEKGAALARSQGKAALAEQIEKAVESYRRRSPRRP
jgi:tetratricopeptide (TPR) repeat protein